MQRWIGRSVIIIGLIHTLVGIVVFGSTLTVLFREGLLNTVHGELDRELAFWFTAFGILAMINHPAHR